MSTSVTHKIFGSHVALNFEHSSTLGNCDIKQRD